MLEHSTAFEPAASRAGRASCFYLGGTLSSGGRSSAVPTTDRVSRGGWKSLQVLPRNHTNKVCLCQELMLIEIGNYFKAALAIK